MNESLLIGETIIYSVDGVSKNTALVMGTVIMKNKLTDIYPTTGYACLIDNKGTIRNIPYWQVMGIAEPDKAFLELLNKKDNGIVIQIYYPKFEKPIHPKGWESDNECNSDLPF